MGAALGCGGREEEGEKGANGGDGNEGEEDFSTKMCSVCFSPEFLCSRCDLIQCSACESKQHKVARLPLPNNLFAEDVSLCDECFAEKEVTPGTVSGQRRTKRMTWHPAEINEDDSNLRFFRPGYDLSRPNAVQVLTRQEYCEIYSVVRKLIQQNIIAGEVQKQMLYDMVCNVDMNLVRQYRQMKGQKIDKKTDFTDKEIKQFAARLMPTQPMA